MAHDPMDAFDKLAEDIRRTHDELDGADKLRSAKAAERQKRKPDDSAAAAVESPERPKADS